MRLVLLRHGESEWNAQNRFTGWTDVDLTERGRAEAREAGRRLKEAGFAFDLVLTSVLRRATDTTALCLDALGQRPSVTETWRLNERHYGALQGLNKQETARQYGEDQVLRWRRSYADPPPALDEDDERNPAKDPRYADADTPLTESLADTVARVRPFWEETVLPALRDGKRVLVSAHGNSLRAIVKILDNLDEEAVTKLNIPTGYPLVYELDGGLRPIKHYYLASDDEIATATKKVAAQGKA